MEIGNRKMEQEERDGTDAFDFFIFYFPFSLSRV